MRKWYHAEANQDMRFVLQQLQDAIDDLDTKLAYHADNEPDVVAASQKSYEVGYEEGKAIAEPLLAATEFALTFEKGRVKILREQNEALRARCERLRAVAKAVVDNHFWAPSVGKALDSLEDGDLFPPKPA